MKHTTSIFFFFVFCILSGCGGGDSDSGAGGSDGAVPQSLVGTYTGTFEGRGSNVNCDPVTFQMTISQSGGNLVVISSTDTIVITPCDNAFNFSNQPGSYNLTTGAVSITTSSGNTTVSINGTASEKDGQIMISGRWSTTATKSDDVIASGTWTAIKQ